MDFNKEPTDKKRPPEETPSNQKSVSSELMQRLEVDSKLPETQVQARIYPYIKRLTDFTLSSTFFIILLPVIVVVALVLFITKRFNVIQYTLKVGKDSRPFNEYTFNSNQRFVQKLPVLVNIIRGDLSFIGPRAVSPDEISEHWSGEALAHKRTNVRPGLISDWWIRRKSSLSYVEELTLDAAYADGCNLRKDLSIIFRALPGMLTSILWENDPPEFDSTIRILDIRIDNLSMQSAIDRIVEMLNEPETRQVSFINPQNFNVSFRQPDYKKVLASSDLVLADGFGTKLAGKILYRPLCQNLCGTDLFPRLCGALSGTDRSIYLLGAAPGAAERVAEWIREHYPDVVITGTTHGYFTPEEEPELIHTIANSGADILIASMGTPTQELFIHRHLGEFNVSVAIGFGGLFDYYAGRIPRAPLWVREIGMEWIYRLIQEPRRMWRRYLIGNGVFLSRILHEKLCPHHFQMEQDSDRPDSTNTQNH